MTIINAAIFAFAIFAGAFASASIFYDLRAAWALYNRLMKGPDHDND